MYEKYDLNIRACHHGLTVMKSSDDAVMVIKSSNDDEVTAMKLSNDDDTMVIKL